VRKELRECSVGIIKQPGTWKQLRREKQSCQEGVWHREPVVYFHASLQSDAEGNGDGGNGRGSGVSVGVRVSRLKGERTSLAPSWRALPRILTDVLRSGCRSFR